MKKTLNKIILFSKGLMPTSKKFYENLKDKLNMTIEDDINSKNPIPRIMIDNVLVNNLNYFNLKNDNYFIIVNENRLELGMQKSITNIDFENFKETFSTILKELNNIYIEIIRVGYIYTYFNSDSSIDKLNIPFLKDSQELKIQYNKRVTYLDYDFNNNITISNNYNDEKGLLIIQDFNFVVKNELILELEIIKNIFDYLKKEYYTDTFEEKILEV